VAHPAPVETLFLDAGGVLVFPNWFRISEALARQGLTAAPDALRRADGRAKLVIDRAEMAAATDAERGGAYVHELLDLTGVPRGDARERALDELYAYHAAHNLWDHANGVLLRMFARVGLTPFFHTICDSGVEGVEKPDPRFFARVLERSGGHPATTLHVGDLYHVDVVGARRSGLRALLLDPWNLYEGYDVERIPSLGALADWLGAERAR
jgi:phosphoglycolate phosphatase-like HAD superfamily hydrolase